MEVVLDMKMNYYKVKNVLLNLFISSLLLTFLTLGY